MIKLYQKAKLLPNYSISFFANIVTELNLAIDEYLLENVDYISHPVLRAIEKYKNHRSVKAISEKYNKNTFSFEHVS